MIGHYLLTLTPEQEDRVLTKQMVAYPERRDACLVQTALGGDLSATAAAMCTAVRDRMWDVPWEGRRSQNIKRFPNEFHYRTVRPLSVGIAYDHLCWRFREARVNQAIRNRILSNQARRVLQPSFVELETV